MTDAIAKVQRRRWLAPRADHGLLAEPALSEAGDIARRNREVLLSASVVIDGQSLAELRAQARSEAILSGRQFLKELSGGRFAATAACCCHAGFDHRVRDSLWFVSGHQPLLAHAGVWVKNIAAAVLADRHDGTGANLIVDQDLIASRSISAPVGPPESPRTTSIAFDDPAGARPGEEILIGDRQSFGQFSETVTEVIHREWDYTPLVDGPWQAGVAEAAASGRLTRALSAVRISLERSHGLTNAEVELSDLSRTGSFLHFFRHIAIHAAEFREAYNRCLSEYREVNRVRSSSHPVPDLGCEGDACELPFWWWRAGDVHRRKVFVRRNGESLELSDGVEVIGSFSAAVSREGADDRIQELRALLAGSDVRLRPRALATTLFSRLCLADLFIHGIGGAKYDEMTDALGEEFFGIEMPAYLTLTGTWWLPLGGGFASARQEWTSAQRAVRDVRYNAEKFLATSAGGAAEPLSGEKRRLVDRLKGLKANRSVGRAGRSERRDVARQLRTVEQQLASLVDHRMAGLVDEQRRLESQLSANRILQSREFAAVLHPMSSYEQWITQIREAVNG